MTVYISTLHDPIPDPPCPVCKGGGVVWKVRGPGQFDPRPCPAGNGPGHRVETEVADEFAAQLLARLRAGARPDGATLRHWIELEQIPED